MSDQSNNMIWIDVETTGLGTPQVKDYLLEIGIRATDNHGETIDEMDTFVPNWEWRKFSELCTKDFVRNMHKESGLWKDYDRWVAQQRSISRTVTQAMLEVEQSIRNFFRKYSPGQKITLAGSSVDFDRSWIKAYFPDLCNDHISHRVLDVSSIIEFCKRLNPELYRKYKALEEGRIAGSHRCLSDLDDSIWKYQFMQDNFMYVYLPDDEIAS